VVERLDRRYLMYLAGELEHDGGLGGIEAGPMRERVLLGQGHQVGDARRVPPGEHREAGVV